jgi:hypothetical protein
LTGILKAFNMKKQKELNVDSIGGQEPLTKAEEKLISEFLKSRSTKKLHTGRQKKVSKGKQVA